MDSNVMEQLDHRDWHSGGAAVAPRLDGLGTWWQTSDVTRPPRRSLGRRAFLRIGGAATIALPLALSARQPAAAQLGPAMARAVMGGVELFASNIAADMTKQALDWVYSQLPWNQRQAVVNRKTAAEARQYTSTKMTNVFVSVPQYWGSTYFWGMPHDRGYSAVVPVFSPDLYQYHRQRYGEDRALNAVPILDGPTALGLAAAAGDWYQYKANASQVLARDALLPLATWRDDDPFPAWDDTFRSSKVFGTASGYVEVYYDGLRSAWTDNRLGTGAVRVRALDPDFGVHFDYEYPIHWA